MLLLHTDQVLVHRFAVGVVRLGSGFAVEGYGILLYQESHTQSRKVGGVGIYILRYSLGGEDGGSFDLCRFRFFAHFGVGQPTLLLRQGFVLSLQQQ